MMNFLCLLIYALIYTVVADKLFLGDSNYGNIANWKEQNLPCDKSHIIFGVKTPKIFINGTQRVYRISEMILSLNGEFILDDAVTITTSDITEINNCNTIEAHYDKDHPDFWYDPKNWCQTKTSRILCQRKPNVEASMVPSESDRVVFRRGYSFYVGVKPSEPKVVVKEILLRGARYGNTFTFRQKIARTSKSKTVEFEKVGSYYAPIIDVKGVKCAGNNCIKNSNLERMTHICPYVTCRPTDCRTTVKPTGACCRLCGHMFRVRIDKFDTFVIWFEDLMESTYKDSLIFNVLAVEVSTLEIVLSSTNVDSDVPDSLASEVVEKILIEKVMVGVSSVEGMSWTMAGHRSATFSSALLTIVVIFLVLLVVAVLVVMRRRIPFVMLITENVNINIPNIRAIKFPTINFDFLRDKFPRSRLQEEDVNVIIPGSSFPSVFSDVEIFELPEKVTDVSFDNPIFESEMAYEDSLQ